MLISGDFVQSVAKTADKSAPTTPQLARGEVISGRVSEVNGRGEGVLRLSDGRGFHFSGGQALKEGEQVRMEVIRLQPQVTFRMLASESGVAQRMAGEMEQSLMRSPDVFARVLNFSGLEGTGVAGKGDGLFSLLASVRQTGQNPLFVTSKGESMARVLQRILPNLSLQSLQQGDLSELLRLLRGGGWGNPGHVAAVAGCRQRSASRSRGGGTRSRGGAGTQCCTSDPHACG